MSAMGILQQLGTATHYRGHWRWARGSYIVDSVKLNTKIADSLILASFNLILAASGFLLLITSYAILFIAVFWCALPISLLLTVAFWIRDYRKGLRRQAKIAALVSLPVLAYEIWLLGFHRLDF
jgi:hypothetical protein